VEKGIGRKEKREMKREKRKGGVRRGKFVVNLQSGVRVRWRENRVKS
jgi:hypothetical protein